MNKIAYVVLAGLVLSSCSKNDGADIQTTSNTVVNTVQAAQTQSEFDLATVKQGEMLYKENCAKCHGDSGEGSVNWRKRKPDGKLLPPPLNGSGHTWHHSKALLMSIIANGSINQGGDMPAWGEKLSSQEIDAVLTWVQSIWPEEVYKNWLEINQR